MVMINRGPVPIEGIAAAAVEGTVSTAPNSLIASAARIRPEDSLWQTYKFADTTWQREAFRFLRNTPELHYAANYIGSACSRVRLYIAEVDKFGRVSKEVDNDDEIMAVADTLFGGPAGKSEALRTIGVNLTVAGECYIIGRSKRDGNGDTWLVVSTTELRRRAGQITVNFGYGPEEILSGRDIVIRLWTPDPECMRLADSPTRACLQVLAELEQLTEFEFSQIDSRLAGAGAYPLPASMTNGPSDPSLPSDSAADDLFNRLAMAAKASRSGRGTAAGVIPVFFEVPDETLQYMMERPIRFDSELSDKLKEYKEGAIHRIATGMNMPPEILLGTGDMNHFSSWFVEESFVKVQIEPMMARIVEGLNRAYLAPLLKALGKKPEDYTLAFDTAPLTVRPNRLQDSINLYQLGIVSADEVLNAADLNPNVAAPSEDEENQRYLKELVLRDPTLFQIPAVREELGFNIDTAPPAPPEQGNPGDLNAPGPPPPPRPARAIESDLPQGAPSSNTGGTPILASAGSEAVLAAANVVARRALELAGGQLLGKSRQYRGQFPDVAKHEIHTRIRVMASDVSGLLDKAFDHISLDFAGQDIDVTPLGSAIKDYCAALLLRSTPHSVERLRWHLTQRELL